MDRAQKRQLVSTLNEEWKGTGVMVIAHYKGMTVAQMTDFRKRMKDAGGSVKVAKNKLAKLALKDTDAEGISALLNGQTCIAYSEDPVSAARIAGIALRSSTFAINPVVRRNEGTPERRGRKRAASARPTPSAERSAPPSARHSHPRTRSRTPSASTGRAP